jgi:hypothetical protein
VETYTTPVTIAGLHVAILRPDNDEPGILSLHADGTRRLNVFADDAECDAFWATLEEALQHEDCIRYSDMFFRSEQLRTLEKGYTHEFGHYLHFVFHNAFEFRQQYKDEQRLNSDLNTLTEILGTLQDIRASKRTSPTKQ